METIVDMKVMWPCEKCGKLTYNHYFDCATCGAARPAPPPETQPQDVAPLAEPPPP